VAVKVVHRLPGSAAAQEFDAAQALERLRRITGQLSGHAAIVPVLETGVTAGNEPYLVTPFYSRGSLAQLMADHGPLAWREATYLIEAAAVTLAEVHGWGVVHRNITPASIMLTDFLLPRVGEFEMCLPIGSPTASSITYAPCYSPPEAVEPVPADPTADVYGLGAVLWALLAGRPPFTSPGERIDALTALDRARANRLAPPSGGTPEPIVELLHRSMAADPAQRPANGAAFVTELRRGVSRAEVPPAPRTQPMPAIDQEVSAVEDGGPSAAGGTSDREMTTVANAVRGEARYILLLVALISLGVVGMFAAALVTSN
jgi:serine/threonine protein kinase